MKKQMTDETVIAELIMNDAYNHFRSQWERAYATGETEASFEHCCMQLLGAFAQEILRKGDRRKDFE
jgi:hypothetical protein